MTTEQNQQPSLTTDQIRALGTDLLLELQEVAGDQDAIRDLFDRWLDVLDWPTLSLVCISALREAFAECVVVVYRSPEEIPRMTDQTDLPTDLDPDEHHRELARLLFGRPDDPDNADDAPEQEEPAPDDPGRSNVVSREGHTRNPPAQYVDNAEFLSDLFFPTHP